MSWDIMIINSKQKINSFEELNEDELIDIDFDSILEKYFKNINKNEDHREIVGQDYSIEYFSNNEPEPVKMFSLYGENGLYALIHYAKDNNWQIFDTGNGEMIDLNNPENNGYGNFQHYLQQILEKK
jgi:hypothetical protein